MIFPFNLNIQNQDPQPEIYINGILGSIDVVGTS